jgi:mRNA-degrading endonuclease YafQ of YafQ-DinJ toxin-antitoxin module
MWEVKIEESAAKVFTGKLLTPEDKIVIQEWAKLVRKNGPDALRRFAQTWADHELYGEWKGFRASRFSYLGRIIYKIEMQIVTVVVVKITTNHNYKK